GGRCNAPQATVQVRVDLKRQCFYPVSHRANSPMGGLSGDRAGSLDFLLKLNDAVHERFRRWWAPGHVDIDGDDPVATTYDGIRIVVIAAAIRARPHGNDPSGLSHLVIHLAQCRS